MKKYITVRLFLILLNVFLLISLLFFALTFANFNKWASMSPKDSYQIIWRLYKVYLEERLLNQNWGLTATGDPIKGLIVPRFFVSLRYNLIALALYFPIGVLIGMISAYRKDGIFDRMFNTFILVFGSIPTYILMFLLIVVLGYQLQLFPPHYSQVPSTFFGNIWGYGIPLIALSLGAIPKISRIIRHEMIDAIDSDYYLLARTKGLTKKQIFLRHLLRNSIAAVLPTMVEVFMLVLTGSFFVEMVFGIEGAAEILYEALIKVFEDYGFNYIQIDVNTIVVVCTFYMVVGFIFSFIVDISYYLIDPRIKIHESKKGTN